MPPVSDLSSLRVSQVGSSALASIAARALQFVSLAAITRLVVKSLGTDAWGTLAAVMAIGGLAGMLDLSLQELTAQQAATARDRDDLVLRLGRALTFAALPATLGIAVLGATIWLLPDWLPQLALPASDLRWLLGSTLAWFLLSLPVCVWAGALQGLGWIRELSTSFLWEMAFDVAAVAACIWTGQSLVVLVWARTARVAVRLLVLALQIRSRHLPTPMPRRVGRQELAALLSFAGSYSVSRGLGLALYRGPVVLAAVWLPPALVGAIAAADQWAGLSYRASHLFYEATFHRFSRFLSAGATSAELSLGQQQLAGLSAVVVGLAVPPGVGLCLLGAPLIDWWVGRELPQVAGVLPWLTWAWLANSAASLSACALLSTGHARASIQAHLAAAATGVGAAWWLAPRLEAGGLAAAALAANLVLLAVLAPSAARVARISVARLGLPLVAIAALGLAAWWAAAPLPLATLPRALLGGLGAALGAALVLRLHPDMRTLLRTSRAAAP